MLYVSTRGDAARTDFGGVLLAGLADDGGLYVPQTWPELDAEAWRALRGLPYPELAAQVIGWFTGAAVDPGDLLAITRGAAARFADPAIVPLVALDDGLYGLELFHGPTLAFKDLAMQVLGGLFERELARTGRTVTIVGATSGDTGSAAIAALAGRPGIELAILHPEGRTSEVQRRQMTTETASNVLNLAVDGDFDDCQALVKAMFADRAFRDTVGLSAVNSINWARIAAQVPYYVHAALALGAPDREIDVAVPTGNFGNVLAAWAARRMGLPIRRLVIGSNRNDILARFLASNDMRVERVVPSLSPSMDIQVSSNFERLLFELLDRDPRALRAAMEGFARTGRMTVPDSAWTRASDCFRGLAVGDDATLAEMRQTHAATGRLIDPHGAVGLAAARAHRDPSVPMVVALTAHPAKFPDAVSRATGQTPRLPAHLADLFDRPERVRRIPNALDAAQQAVRAHLAAGRPAAHAPAA